jgi:hypothetical protein
VNVQVCSRQMSTGHPLAEGAWPRCTQETSGSRRLSRDVSLTSSCCLESASIDATGVDAPIPLVWSLLDGSIKSIIQKKQHIGKANRTGGQSGLTSSPRFGQQKRFKNQPIRAAASAIAARGRRKPTEKQRVRWLAWRASDRAVAHGAPAFALPCCAGGPVSRPQGATSPVAGAGRRLRWPAPADAAFGAHARPPPPGRRHPALSPRASPRAAPLARGRVRELFSRCPFSSHARRPAPDIRRITHRRIALALIAVRGTRGMSAFAPASGRARAEIGCLRDPLRGLGPSPCA